MNGRHKAGTDDKPTFRCRPRSFRCAPAFASPPWCCTTRSLVADVPVALATPYGSPFPPTNPPETHRPRVMQVTTDHHGWMDGQWRPRITVGRESEATTVLADAPYLFVCVCVCGGENSLERRRWRRVRGTTVCGLTNVVRPNRRKTSRWAVGRTFLLSSFLLMCTVWATGLSVCVSVCVCGRRWVDDSTAVIRRKSMKTIVWWRDGSETKNCYYGSEAADTGNLFWEQILSFLSWIAVLITVVTRRHVLRKYNINKS